MLVKVFFANLKIWATSRSNFQLLHSASNIFIMWQLFYIFSTSYLAFDIFFEFG